MRMDGSECKRVLRKLPSLASDATRSDDDSSEVLLVWEPKPDWWDDEEDGEYPEQPSVALAVSSFSLLARIIIVVGALQTNGLPFSR